MYNNYCDENQSRKKIQDFVTYTVIYSIEVVKSQ